MTTKEKEMLNEIFSLIDSIKEHADMLNTDERISELELDMILSKIKNLHEKMVVLKYLHTNIEDIIEKYMQKQIDKSDEAKIEQENEQQEEIITAEAENDISDNKQFITEEKNDTLEQKLKNQPLYDLTKIIGINEKFLFINELFGGSEDDFNECINYLNKSDNFLDADTYIRNTLRTKHDWDLNKAFVMDFIELVERRYLSPS